MTVRTGYLVIPQNVIDTQPTFYHHVMPVVLTDKDPNDIGFHIQECKMSRIWNKENAGGMNTVFVGSGLNKTMFVKTPFIDDLLALEQLVDQPQPFVPPQIKLHKTVWFIKKGMFLRYYSEKAMSKKDKKRAIQAYKSITESFDDITQSREYK